MPGTAGRPHRRLGQPDDDICRRQSWQSVPEGFTRQPLQQVAQHRPPGQALWDDQTETRATMALRRVVPAKAELEFTVLEAQPARHHCCKFFRPVQPALRPQAAILRCRPLRHRGTAGMPIRRRGAGDPWRDGHESRRGRRGYACAPGSRAYVCGALRMADKSVSWLWPFKRNARLHPRGHFLSRSNFCLALWITYLQPARIHFELRVANRQITRSLQKYSNTFSNIE